MEINDLLPRKVRGDRKDSHTGKRCDNKPVTYQDGNVIKEKNNKGRDRIGKVYNRARKISEKVRINQEIKSDISAYFVPIDFDDDLGESVESISSERMNKFIDELGLSIENYFLTGNVEAAIADLKELYDPEFKRMILYGAIEKALNYKPKQCEMVSTYLAAASMKEILVDVDFMKGFNVIYSDIHDLEIDFPHATQQIATFLARAIIDECLPPIYLKNQLETQKNKKIRKSLKHATDLYRHSLSYTDTNKIWGECTGIFGASELLRQMNRILMKYFEDGVFKNFFDSIIELGAPHFHHAVVKEIFRYMISNDNVEVFKKVLSLIENISQNALMTDEQIEQGLDEIIDEFDIIVIDNPDAKKTLKRLLERAEAFLPKRVTWKAHKYNVC